MKSLIYLLIILLSNYSFCEELLGGWSTSTDDSLIQDCLKRALDHISGSPVSNDDQAQATNIVCKTQIVNGLNIKLIFNYHEKKWHCSFYKSFIQTLDTQLERCKQVEDEPLPVENDDEKSPEKQDEQVVKEQVPSNDGEQPPVNDGVKEEQAPANDGAKEEQAPANDGARQEQVAPTAIEDKEEADDEAKIDALQQPVPDENADNNQEHQ